MFLRFPNALALSFVCLATPAVVSAEVQTFTATHTYILGDHDSKEDARQRCLLETKRKILEQAGVYIESASEVKDLQLTKDKITSFAAAVMQVKDTKEEVGVQQGHITLTLTTTAQVDLEEVRKQLAARQLDAGVREDVAAQKERLKRLEAQLETMQRRQGGQVLEQMSAPSPSDTSAAGVQYLRTLAGQGDANAQWLLADMYVNGRGVPQNYATARQWYERAAAQGDAEAQYDLGVLYFLGWGVPEDYAMAGKWYERAAIQGHARAQYFLGMLYLFGWGVPMDRAKAARWYEQAATQGHARAQIGLGMLYANGWGVPKDHVRAYMWDNLAAADSTGDEQELAEHMRDDFARSMTPAQIAEAQRLSQQCQTRQFKGC